MDGHVNFIDFLTLYDIIISTGNYILNFIFFTFYFIFHSLFPFYFDIFERTYILYPLTRNKLHIIIKEKYYEKLLIEKSDSASKKRWMV